MSIRELGLKELRALAQQRLGTKAAELKTRQELVDALEKLEKKKAPRLMVPLAAPLPEPEVRPPAKELPPEPVIWTGDAPLPQITALPLVKEFPKERLVWSAQVIVAPPPVAAAPLALVAVPPPFIPSEVEGPSAPAAPAPPPFIPSGVEGPSVPAAPVTTPVVAPGGPSTSLGMNGLSSPAGSSTVSTVTAHFFLEPEKPRLPLTYEDDRVLTFARDPKSLYASWDIEPSRFEEGPATGRVVNEAGETVHSFAVAGPSGGLFVDPLPPGEKVKIEVRTETGILGESGWVTMPSAPRVLPADPINAPSSVV